MTDLTPDMLDEIEKAAKEATPGPWKVIPATIDDGRRIDTPAYELMGVDIDSPFLDTTDAEHIATMDPPTTLALVARVRELEAQRAKSAYGGEVTMWEALKILGFDTDGDQGPAAHIAAMGRDGYHRMFLEHVRDFAAAYEEALGEES